MAHSNRKKLREARGGLTRNQARKNKKLANSAGQADRFQEISHWMKNNEEKKRQTVSTVSKDAKVVRYAKTKNARIRREGALERLQADYNKCKFHIKSEEEKSSKDKEYPKGVLNTLISANKRREKEINILKGRV